MHMSFLRDGISHRGERAVHIWNAAGSVTRTGDEGVKMEDAARMYLHALANECMITAEDYTPQMLIKTFSIDGFLHKICITKAQEEIGFEILRNEEYCRPPYKPRYRAIYCTRDKFKYSTEDKHLLSLFFYGGGNLDASPSYWENFEELRILDLEGFGLKSLPETICALGRLRYLGLRDNHLQELPHTLSRLKNLEVLDIALNFMIELPDILWEMDSLRHLYMCDVISRSPLKIDSLKYLQTLTFISVNNWVYELSNLEKMTSLCKLGIEELDENSDVSKLFKSLAKLENLKHLILRGLRFKSMPQLDGLSNLHGIIRLKVDGRLTKLPKFPPNIRYLNLVNSCLDEDPMPELEKIPSLYYLKLRNAYTGREMVISQHGLQDLDVLHIIELKHLRNLRLGEYLTGLLEILEIWTCPYLDNIPEEMLRFGPWKIGKLSFLTTKKIAKLIQQSGITTRNPVLLLPSGGVCV